MKELKRNRYQFENSGRICRLFFTDGGSFIVDASDFNEVSEHYWQLGKRGYPVFRTSRKSEGGARNITLHTLLIRGMPGYDVDHINGDKMDNRRYNLRLCTHQQNMFNQGLRNTNSSGYIGVSYSKAMRKFESYIHKDGHKMTIGYFDDPLEAAKARDRTAKTLFGVYARMNVLNQ